MHSLSDYFRDEVPDSIRRRGRSLFLSGGVYLVPEGGGYRGFVADDGQYQIQVRANYEGLRFSCTCDEAYFLDLCTHLWAAVLKLDDMGVVPSEGGLEVEGGGDGQRGSELGWRQRLQGIRVRSCVERTYVRGESTPFMGQIGYLIDVEACGYSAAMVTVPFLRQRLKNGKLGVPTRVSASHRDFLRFPLVDRQILSVASENDRGPWRGSRAYEEFDESMLPLILPFLANTGRVYAWYDLEDGKLPRKMGAPLSFCLEPASLEAHHEHDPDEECARVRLVLKRNGESKIVDSKLIPLGEQYVLIENRIEAIEEVTDALVANLVSHGALTVPLAEDGEFLSEVLQIEDDVALQSDRLKIIEGKDPRGCVHLDAPVDGGVRRALIGAKLEYDYVDAKVPFTEARRMIPVEDGQILRRDEGGEERLMTELGELGCLLPDGRYRHQPEVPTKKFEAIVLGLDAAGWTVTVRGKALHAISTPSVTVTSNRDWFDVEACVRVGDKPMHLPELLSKIEPGSRMIRLDDGTHGILPGKWLDSWDRLLNFGQVEDDHFRLRANQSWVLDALLAAQPDTELTADAACTAARRQLQDLHGVKAKSPPRGFVGTLRPYQRDGLGWLHFLQKTGLGGCLADDMGLGKTVQVLALLESRRAKRDVKKASLVVVPNSLMFNWNEEAARFTPKMRVLQFSGSQRWAASDDPEKIFNKYDIVLTTYGTLRRDITRYKDYEWDYVILDEAQAIKNASSQASKAARLLRANHHLAMSGTPIENHLGELWALFDFINPGMLGRSKVFQDFLKQRDSLGAEAQQALLEQLGRGLSPFLLRRKKDEVLDDLPEKTELVLHCELPKTQRKSYDGLRKHYQRILLSDAKAEDLDRMKIVVLEALLRLRQTACHPGLIDAARTEEACAKFDVLIPKLEELISENHKALVFSQFPSFLSLLRTRLDALGIKYEYLDGKTKKRQACVERFQSDADCPLFLISLKAGGHGLNLTAADYVFILDPWWNPAVEAQAVDRAHRIGQQNKVMAYRLLCKDTVEERVAELQAEKKQIADAILSADKSLLKSLTVADLGVLLS